MMKSAAIKFLGSACEDLNKCFTIGKSYHADVSSAGNFFVYDDNGETWVIEQDDYDFEVME